ncbi:neuroblast differentiation-associated protein AHNAK [Pseudochaenichthys georgianus]|uniref:neuroblast differentiation-associated protein AHNAK n=1 Tax=Pseudochaenichthys georgianus TaxID=52239 RepID=UPI00146F375A|nr:neuroblast differentiation-associated protein AHNAK-like [Pseudochaenichthys georgianus]
MACVKACTSQDFISAAGVSTTAAIMCDCFHLALPNWHAASSGTGAGRRLRAPEPGTEDDSTCDEPSQFTERERPRPQGSSPVEEYPETEKYTDSDKECEAEHDPYHKSGSGKKSKKSGLGSMFEKRSTPKMSKLKEDHSPESGVMVKTAQDGCSEGLVYGGGGREGIFIKEVVPESPASNLKLKEGDRILSATVYFDNMSYEDAIQILEHAQAYKVKLCLKRTPVITETEPVTESDIIPEEDVYAPEMRENGKTKRRSDARISWPKFPSFGKGKKKSRFSRSHSSSEAEEQRKLELSPTTSDTESPIKSQDALKGKKKHKIKLPLLSKRGRISSSEDQDTDAPTTAQLVSPETLESPSGETPQVYVTEELKVVENLRWEEKEAKTVQHKVELITIDSTLKTEDITLALAGEERSSGVKSPDGKKKKKECSELKMKILGKDKSHKKDGKAKSSPKRLKTLGASIETADQSENKKGAYSQAKSEGINVPKVELEVSDVTLIQKSPQKVEEKTKTGKDIKQKQEIKTGPTFKMPKIGFSDIAKVDVNVGECTTKTEQLTTEGTEEKVDPYDRLSKRISKTKLPKREDIEIPGMEDMSMKTTAKGIKVPKAVFTGHYEKIQAETVQMLIDVDSVKEAVSKLPGFKVPKVDTSGMLIPEEITVIDANAQRISVKTPTKTKHGAHFSKADITATHEFSKTTIKLPKITPSYLTSEELVMETKSKVEVKHSDVPKVDVSFEKAHILMPDAKAKVKEIDLEMKALQTEPEGQGYKFKMPKFGISIPEVKGPAFDLGLSKKDVDVTLPEAKVEFNLPEVKPKLPSAEMPRVKGPYVDSSLSKKDTDITFTGTKAEIKFPKAPKMDVSIEKAEVFISEAKVEVKKPEKEIKLSQTGIELEGNRGKFKIPTFGITMPTFEGPEIDSTISKTNIDVKIPDAKAKVELPEAPKIAVEMKPPEYESERDEKGSKFKMPKFGISMPKVKGPQIDLSIPKKDKDMTLPEAKTEVKLPDVPKIDVDIKAPECEAEMDVQGSKFKMPKFGITFPKVKGPEIDLSISKKDVDVTLPEAKAEVDLPEAPIIDVDMKAPECEAEMDGQESKFKMLKFGMKMPKVKGPQIDLSFLKKDVDVTIPEAKAEVELSGAPTIMVDMKLPEGEAEMDGQGSKFNKPKFGISMPKVKESETDFSYFSITIPENKLPDVELKQPSAKVEIKAPEIEAQGSSKKGSPSKFKMPTFNFPKFGAATPNLSAEVPDIEKEIKIDGADLRIAVPHTDVDAPDVKAEVRLPEIEVKHILGTVVIEQQPEVEIDAKLKKRRFSMPRFSFSKGSVKVPEVDANVQDVNVAIPEGKVEVKVREVETKLPECEADVDRKGSKFKMSTFGITMPKVTGTEIDLSLSKKDVDIKFPEAKAEVQLPEIKIKQPSASVEIKAHEIDRKKIGDVEGSLSKPKMPTFTVPTFGAATSKVIVDKPDVDLHIDGATVDVTVPSIDTEDLSVDIKAKEGDIERSGSKFKMPKFGISMPRVKGPELDSSLSKKDLEVTLPKAKAEINLASVEIIQPEVEIKAPEIKVATKDKERSSSKFKMPTIKLPTFGVNIPSATVEVSEKDKDIRIDGADITIPEEVLAVHITAPIVDTEDPSIVIKTEGKESKFKLPSLGFSGPQIKQPDLDLGLEKKDMHVTLPAKAEVNLPDVGLKEPSAQVDIKGPQIKMGEKGTEGSPSRFKMPSFKLPKFGVGTSSATVEVPDTDRDITIDGTKITISGEVLAVDIAGPSIETEVPSVDKTETQQEQKGSNFKLPSLGFSGPQIKLPDMDLSLSQKDIHVTQPEATADVKLPDVGLKKPSAEVELKGPEIKVVKKGSDGSTSKFKMPTFKLPKFGVSTSSAAVEVPNTDKEIKIDGADIKIPEEVLAVHIQAPSIDTEGPSIDIKTTGTEHGEKGSKFQLQSLGFSGPQIKRPDIDLSFSKKDVDVTLPEAKAEVKPHQFGLKETTADIEMKSPEIKVEPKGKEGSPSKFKMPSFKLPKFGIGLPSATVALPDTDTDIKIDGSDITIPEEVLSVHITAPSIDNEGPKIDIKTTGTEHEGKGSKFNMPSFGFSGPSIKRPEIDLSFSKKEFDVTLPETKAEVELPKVGLKENLAEVEIKSPEIKVEPKGKEGSPSKFKMPSFKLPKFGIGLPSATVALPDTDTDIKIDGSDITIPEEVLSVHITAPSIDNEGPKIDIKTTGTEHEGKGSKFNMPSFGFSGPSIKRPEIDLSFSKKEFDVTLPETKAEVELPKVGLKENLAEVEIKSPEIKVEPKGKEGSPSKFKMPSFKLPTFGIGLPSATVALPDTDTDINIDGSDITIPEEVLSVHITAPSIDNEGPKIDIKTTGTEHEGKGSKFNMPSFGFSGPSIKRPEIDLSFSKKEFDVTLPETKAEVELPKVGLKENLAEVEIKSPEIKVEPKGKEGSPSKFKMPSFKLPKFGIGLPSATVALPDTDTDIKIDGSDITIPEEVLSVHITAPSIDNEGPNIDNKTTGTEHEGKGSKFNMPSFGFSGPSIKRPEIDLSFSKKEFDVTLPETKAEVELPKVGLKENLAEVEIKSPEIKVEPKGKEGSPSKFKMPSFKLPKFGIGLPSATVALPDTDTDIKIDGSDITIPEEVLSVHITAPSIDNEGPNIDIKTTGTEHEGKGSKFNMPSFGFSGPQIKRPDIDLSFSKKEVDVTLPETKAEVELSKVGLKETLAEIEIKSPEIKVEPKGKDGSPSKFKMPSFKLPKFGVSLPSTTVALPDVEKDIKIDGSHITIPEEVLAVHITAPNIETKGTSIDIKTTVSEHEGKESKFKLPSLGFSGPQTKRPDIDLSLSKKDVDVTLPESKAEVKIPVVKLKKPSAEVEIKAPEIKIATKGKEGSPSKYKMPTFKLPTFGVGTPSATIKVQDRDIKINGADVTIPEEVLSVHIAAPNIETEGPSIDIKTKGTEPEVKGNKFKMPSLGFSGPQIKRPDIDISLSKKAVDVTLPEAKTEVNLPQVEIKEESKAEDKRPDVEKIEGDAKLKKSSWTMPRFSFSTASVKAPEADVNADAPKVDVTLPEVKTDVHIPDIDIKETSGISMEGAHSTDIDTKMKKTRFSLPRFSFSKQGSKESKVDVSVPNVDVSLQEGNVEGKHPAVEVKPQEADVELQGQESKFKMPKFGISMPKVKGPEFDSSVSKKDLEVTLPETKAEINLPNVEVKGPEVEIQAATMNTEGSPSKLKMPTFNLPTFGVGIPSASVEVPDTDKVIRIDEIDITIPEKVLAVHITAPSLDTEGQSIEQEVKGSKFKLPSLGFSGPQTKRPGIDLSSSKKDVDVTLPGAKAKVKLPEARLKDPSTEVEMKGPEIKIATQGTEGSPSKYKMPTFKLPKFGVGTPSATVKVPETDFKLDGADIPEEDLAVHIAKASLDNEGPSIDIKTTGTKHEGKESKFKLPSLGFSGPQNKRPDIDLSLSKVDGDVTLPEAKAGVKLPHVELKESSAKVEIKAPKIDVQTSNVEGSPSKYKMPTFKLPKFGVSTPSATVEGPNTDINIPEEVLSVHITAPSIDTEGPSIDIKTTGTEHEGKGSKFKLPGFGFSGPQVKQPDIDISLSKKDVNVILPETKEAKETEGVISVTDAPTVDIDTKKQATWAFPRFSFSRSAGKASDDEPETPKVDVTLPKAEAEVQGGLSGAVSIEEPPAAELDPNLKKRQFSLPRFSFSRSSVKEPAVSAELPHVDVSLSEGEVIVKQPEMKIKAPELEAEHDGQGSTFQLPKFGIALPKVKGSEDINASQKDVDITVTDVKAKVTLPDIEAKEYSASVEMKDSEIEAQSKGVGGLPFKFKMPTLKMPKFEVATHDVTVKAPDSDKVDETDGAKHKEDITLIIKGTSVDIKTDETSSVDLGSPSKFKLPSFKLPKLSFSIPNAEGEHVPVDTESKEDQLKIEVDPKGESKSQKVTLTSFGEIIKNFDVEIDAAKPEEQLQTLKEVQETVERNGKQPEAKEKETKQDTTKSPERTSWLKFPRFGLSSPSEPAKTVEKEEQKDEKSPVGETSNEEISPTSSVQSSDAFADISSAMTSEHLGLSLSSPTKVVTVKFSDPNVASSPGEMHSNIISSTTRTEIISVEPKLPEKITILSSGASSSSEDTLRLDSGKLHVFTSNIQATPESQYAKLLTDFQIQSAGGLPLEPEAYKAASWTVEDPESGKRTVYERHLVKETSSESKETIVITQQITRTFDSSETASSIQRLKDSMHSDKMRFFDGADE